MHCLANCNLNQRFPYDTKQPHPFCSGSASPPMDRVLSIFRSKLRFGFPLDGFSPLVAKVGPRSNMATLPLKPSSVPRFRTYSSRARFDLAVARTIVVKAVSILARVLAEHSQNCSIVI